MEQNFLKVMKAINQQSLLSKLFMLFERCWECKQKIIQWWSRWPGRICSEKMMLFIEVCSTALVLLLTLVAPLRNWPNSTKSSKRLKMLNFNLEYEIFCELMQPKLFKNFSCIKWKLNVLWTDFLIFFLSVYLHFR